MFRRLMMSVGLLCILLSVTASYAKPVFQPEVLWPQMASGRYFNFPEGITRDKQGYFYITDGGSHRVKVLNAQGDLIRSWGGFGTGPGQFNDPGGIILTDRGEILVADFNNSRIQKFTTDGQFLMQWGGQGNAQGQLNHPTNLAIDAQGQVYVSDTWNNRIEVFTTEGQWLRSFGSFGNGLGQLNDPIGITFSPDNELYIAELSNHRISVFDTQGRFVRAWGSKGTANGQFDNPQNLAFDAQGNVYVTEYGNNRIQVFQRNGLWLRTWGKKGYSGAALWRPFGLVIDNSDASVYVADSSNNRIQHYDLQGNYLLSWGSASSQSGEFSSPYVSVSPKGDVYVADSDNDRIQVFNTSGQWLRGFGSFGSQPGQLNSPTFVAFTPQEQLLVADFNNDRIQVFDAQGQYLRTFGSSGAAQGQLDGPSNLFLTADGLLYITELWNNRVSVFTLEGQYVRSWGSLGSNAGQFSKPDGIVVDAAGLVYISDRGNNRIQVFTAQGQFIRQFGKLGYKDGEFNTPSGLALAPNGLLYIADAWNNRVQVLTREGAWQETIGGPGTQPGQFSQPYSVALADDNTLYVGESASNRVQKLVRKELVRAPYKAILVAGSGPDALATDDSMWNVTQELTNDAYNTLRTQGLSKEAIRYLTAGAPSDLDENGQMDDTQPATLTNLQQALTEWASDADEVLLYLNGHGDVGTFKLNNDEILTSEKLKFWLDTLNSRIGGKVTVIIDACQSGSFLEGLTNIKSTSRRLTPRTFMPFNLITSATSAQPAVVSNSPRGTIAFSKPFWQAVKKGSTLQTAFATARNAIGQQMVFVNNKPQPQTALLDANGDGRSTNDDLSSLGKYCFGRCQYIAADEPTIKVVTTDGQLNGQTRYSLTMTVSALAPIETAWVVITRPDANHAQANQPVNHLLELELPCSVPQDGQYRCSTEYTQFDVNGDYYVSFHVRDQKNRSSTASTRVVLTQSGKNSSADSTDNSVYDATRDQVTVQDVLVGTEHYKITLQRLSTGQLKLISYSQTNQRFNIPASYNVNTGLLTLPRVRVGSQYYQAALLNLGNFLFQVQALKPLT